MYVRVEDFGACFDTRTHRVVSTSGIGAAFCLVRPHFCFGVAGAVSRELRDRRVHRLLRPAGPLRAAVRSAGVRAGCHVATVAGMRRFNLRTIKLRSGEEYRDEIELELQPFEL